MLPNDDTMCSMVMFLVSVRKKKGFNVAAYDREYGRSAGKPNVMDFLSCQGFVSAPQLDHRYYFLFVFLPGQARDLCMSEAGSWVYGPDGA